MTRIEVRQQTGVLQHGARSLREVGQGGVMAEANELVGGAAVAALRLVAEREQRLLAARGRPGPRDGEHFVEGQIGALVLARGMSEHAVMADVAAKPCERDENLARV